MSKGDNKAYLETQPLTEVELERFYSKIKPILISGCWEWDGARDQPTTGEGYGQVTWRTHSLKSHILMWFIEFGYWPKNELDHLCKNPPCCNVRHLRDVTSKVNTLAGESPPAKNARKTHCDKDHPLFGENLRVRANGKRECRECQRESDRKRYRVKYEKEKLLNTHDSAPVKGKLTFEIAEEIRAKYAEGNTSQRKLAREYQVSQPLVGTVLRREAWIGTAEE